MKTQPYKIVLLFLLATLLIGCGGYGDEPPVSDPQHIWFSFPARGSSTDRPRIDMGGTSYGSSSAKCTSIFGGTISGAYKVTWHNGANNASGSATVGINCILIGFVYWNAFNIPLELGGNEITVRVVDPGDGIDGTNTMTVYRLADTTPPEVIKTSPANDNTNVQVLRTILVDFSEEMDATSLNTSTFVVKDQSNNSIAGTVSYSEWSGYQAKFTPDFPLSYSTTYTATITTGAKDYHGANRLLADYSWSFTTRSNPDVISPSVINTSPAQNSYCAAVSSPVTATFDEAIDPDTLTNNSFYLQDALGNPVAATLSYSQPVMILQPQTSLNYNSAYTATLTPAIADYAGNTLAMDYMLDFTTVANDGSGNWASASFNGAPTDLNTPVAVWTGEKMIVWGLEISYDWYWSTWNYIGSGGVYDPVMDSWSELSLGPTGLLHRSAVWTGTEMIIWGGYLSGTVRGDGAAYNPSTDSWRTISSAGAPSARRFHNAVWTGSEMIIWGGTNGSVSYSDGARYNPVTDSWTPMSNTNVPSHGDLYSNRRSAVWTGTEMIIWNGWTPAQSARYSPATDSWSPVSTSNAPASFNSHRAVWTGTEMLVWGGSNIHSQLGARYDPETDTWSNMSMLCGLESRSNMEVVWTGSKMIIWGGSINNGAIYTPSTDSWEMMNNSDAPTKRKEHTMVWTGSEVIVWGGLNPDNNRLNTGGRFFP